MKILVLGGTRFIGKALVRRLAKDGHSVAVLTRDAEHARRAGVDSLATITAADRGDAAALKRLARESFDVVFDFLGMSGVDATKAAQAFEGKTKRFVQLSTGSIYWVQDAERCPWIEADDSFPLRDRATCDHGEFDYGVAKRDAEAVYRGFARASGFPLVLVRAPVVSGPDDWRRRDLYWARRILEGRPCVMPDGGRNVFNHVYVDDLVELLVRIALAPAIAPGEAFNAADRVFTTLRQYVGWFGDVLGKEPRLVDVPRPAIAAAGLHDRSFFFADTKSHVLDNRKAESAFGLSFLTPDRWIPPTAAWCRAQPPDRAEDVRLEAEARLADAC